jgi:DNA-binding NarL/FixJ family response regulator
MTPVTIGIVDDHQLFLKSLSTLIASLPGYTIVLEALNGKEMVDKLSTIQAPPDIILIDVTMPVMDGFATARYLNEHHPLVKTIALSMKDDDFSVIGMIKAGCCAYLLKDIHPNELERALQEVIERGYYNADVSNLHFRRLFLSGKEATPTVTERERTFITHACSDMTYKEIAARMHLSERTIDGYREVLFQKFNVQSRVGLVLEAIRRKLVTV